MQHAVVPTSSASQLFVNNNCTLFTFQSLVLMNAGTTRWETLSCRSKWTPSGAKSNGHELCKKVCGCIHTAVHWAEMCHNLWRSNSEDSCKTSQDHQLLWLSVILLCYAICCSVIIPASSHFVHFDTFSHVWTSASKPHLHMRGSRQKLTLLFCWVIITSFLLCASLAMSIEWKSHKRSHNLPAFCYPLLPLCLGLGLSGCAVKIQPRHRLSFLSRHEKWPRFTLSRQKVAKNFICTKGCQKPKSLASNALANINVISLV